METNDHFESGPIEEFNANGSLKQRMTIIDGEYDGPFEEYDSNGRLMEKCIFKKGILDGPYESYHENGQLDKKCCYKNDELIGPEETYYDNGQLWSNANYTDGSLDGLLEIYWENSKLLHKCLYKHIPEIKTPDYISNPRNFYHRFFDVKNDGNFLVNLNDKFNKASIFLRDIGFDELIINDPIVFDRNRDNEILIRNCKSLLTTH